MDSYKYFENTIWLLEVQIPNRKPCIEATLSRKNKNKSLAFWILLLQKTFETLQQ